MKYQGLVMMILMLNVIMCYQSKVSGEQSSSKCPITVTGGMLCQAAYKRFEINQSVVYKFTNISCTGGFDQGYQQTLNVNKLTSVKAQNDKLGQFESEKEQEDKATHKMDGRRSSKLLKISKVFRRILSSMTEICLTQNENNASLETDLIVKGYKMFAAGTNVTYMKRYENRTTWDQALKICQAENGSLVKIDSINKVKFIEKEIMFADDLYKRYQKIIVNAIKHQSNKTFTDLPITTFFMWIGLRDFKGNDVHEWIDGSPLNFTDWMAGEPVKKDTINESLVDSDCVVLFHHLWKKGHWDDQYCDRINGFICEFPV